MPVLGDRTAMAQAAARTGATVLVIAIARASGTAIRDLTAEAERCGLVPKVVPSIAELLSGVARIEGVRDPRISDLLGRRPVQTDVASVAGHFAGKRILVTGAGGSIGSELCRQLHRFEPAELIMLDRDESALHAVQLDLHGRALLDSDGSVLADIRDQRRIRQVFDQFRPQIVFHAAALKHLPLLERYPAEALKTNVWGTCTVLEAAAACGVESFVNISTDKAADPVSVLGYSKRAAERLTAHMAGQAVGTYLSVRFGNVLGSRGSVLTALSAQVAAGGPVTVTHPEVTRYFMTADEAVQLVLQAAVIGRDGEVLVLDMGEQIRIADMARRLVATVPRQVDIVYTGLRPGEKLAEDLLGEGERGRAPVPSADPARPRGPDVAGGGDRPRPRRRPGRAAQGPGRRRGQRSRPRRSHPTGQIRPGRSADQHRPTSRSSRPLSIAAVFTYPPSGPPVGSATSSAALSPSSAVRSRPSWARASQPARLSPGARGPTASPRRTSSLSVNARGHTAGAVTTAWRRFSLAMASVRSAASRSSAVTRRLRCAAISSP